MSTKLNIIETQTAQCGVVILSHSRARSFSPGKHGVAGETAMIRIEDPGVEMKQLQFEREFKEVRHFHFDDVNQESPIYRAFTTRDAENVLDFFMKVKDRKLLVVHCHAGVCRSSAVAAAFCKFIGDEETHKRIWECDLYVPNTLVYFKLIRLMEEKGILSGQVTEPTPEEEIAEATEWVERNGWSTES